MKLQRNYIELIIDIKKEQEVQGYLYIQSSLKDMDSFIEKGERSPKTIKEFLDSMELRDQLDEASNQKEKSKVGVAYTVLNDAGQVVEVQPNGRKRLIADVDAYAEIPDSAA